MSTGRGVAVTLAGQWARFAIQTASFVILSRILTPGDFGLLAMTAVLVGVAAMLADFGLSLAAVREANLSEGRKSALVVLNTGAGAAAAIAVIASGPVLSAFYSEPRVSAIAAALAAPLLINGFAAQFRVEINRNGRFRTLAMQDIAGAASSSTVAIALAISGAGYWALVAQAIVQPAAVAVLSVFQARWVPRHKPSFTGTAGLVGFGWNTLLVQLLNLASRSADVASIGRSGSIAEVGQYSRASQLISLVFAQIVSPLTRVILPKLSSSSETDLGRLLRDLQLVIVYSLGTCLAGVASLSIWAVPLVLGDDWLLAGVVTAILAIGAFFACLGYVYYWAFLARNASKLLLLAEAPGRCIMIVGAVLLAPHGPLAVAAMIALGQFVTFGLSSMIVGRIGVRRGLLLGAAGRPLALLLCAASATALLGSFTQPTNALGLAVLTTAFLATLTASSLLRSYRSDYRRLFQTVKRLRG